MKKKQMQMKSEGIDFTEEEKEEMVRMTKLLREGKIKIKIDGDDWDII